MKIAIDISQVVHGTGVSFYTRNLVLSLANLDRRNEYLLFGYSLRQNKVLGDFVREAREINPRFSGRIFPLPPSLVEGMGNLWPRPAVESVLGPIDLYHSSDWVEFPSRAAKVTTIHDFSFWKFPQTAHPKIEKVMVRRLGNVRREADGVIAISQATARSGVEMAGIPREKMEVIYEAAGEIFKPSGPGKIKTIKEKYLLPSHYFLAVTNLDPRKNLARITEAFNLFSQRRAGWSLVVVGKAGWDEVKLSARAHLVMAGYVPLEDLRDLYSGSAGLVFPSLDEGFGLPVIEAMACGCPVLTSGCSSLPEVAGKAAVYVDPLSVPAIAHGLEQLVVDRETLVKDGYRQAAAFSWRKTAQQTQAFYEKTYSQKRAKI